MHQASQTTSQRDSEPGIPVLPSVAMHLHQVMEPAIGTVVSTERCTASSKSASYVRHVAIDVSGSRLAGNFRPGQSFGVLPHAVLSGGDAPPTPHKLRLYSIASPSRGEDGRGNVIATTVKRLIDEHWETHKLHLGVASNFLCDLQVGDKLAVTGPAGKRFLLPVDPSRHDYLFIATGTGIAPFRGMITDLLEGSPHHPATNSAITLVAGSAYRTDLIYHRQLAALAKEHPSFQYWPSVSREAIVDTESVPTRITRPMYVQERLGQNADALIRMLKDGRTLLYICGLAGMELGIFQTLARILPAELLALYLEIDQSVAADPAAWDRKMISRQIKPTKRVFLEVY